MTRYPEEKPMTQDKPLSFTLRFVLGLAAAGVALVLMNRAAEFIVQLLFAWVIVLSAGPLFSGCRRRGCRAG
jgi:hypothetical protein